MFRNFITKVSKIHSVCGEETAGGEFKEVPDPELGIHLRSVEWLESRVLTWEVLSITRRRLLEAVIFRNKLVLKKRTLSVFETTALIVV
jgi:hypothetical protein